MRSLNRKWLSPHLLEKEGKVILFLLSYSMNKLVHDKEELKAFKFWIFKSFIDYSTIVLMES